MKSIWEHYGAVKLETWIIQHGHARNKAFARLRIITVEGVRTVEESRIYG